MNYAGKKVLVTGSAGFIGSHLVEALVQSGASVRAFVHYNALGSAGWLDHSTAKPSVELFAGDIADAHSVRLASADREIVFHLAALISIPYSYSAPRSFVETNVLGTLSILEAARETKPARVVVTSTSEVYGSAQFVPMTEQHPLVGQSPYSASKIAADKFAESYFRSFGVPVVILRPFNTYGPRQSTRAVIPSLLTQIRRGDRIELGDTRPTRDFTFVLDTVHAFMKAGLAKNIEGETIHLGTGVETSIDELIKRMEKVVGRPLEVTTDPGKLRPAASEVTRLIANAEKAHRLLDWHPEVSLDQGLDLTLRWLEQLPGDLQTGRHFR